MKIINVPAAAGFRTVHLWIEKEPFSHDANTVLGMIWRHIDAAVWLTGLNFKQNS